MSGGSLDYVCYKIENELSGMMQDAELNDLVKDFAKLAHDLEWALSSDTSMDSYFETVRKFKRKWFGTGREERLKRYIDESLKKQKEELYRLVGAEEKHE